ncbi:MAG: hypothetical protein PHT49_03920 [Desulfovibrionales bacterium]|nr:hypothetical protein [Desulfovibrionales bacterium]
MGRIQKTEDRRQETKESVEELLKEKEGLCLKLKENMQAFKGALQSGDAGLLATVTGQRDRVMKAIDAIDRRLSLAGFRPASGQSETPMSQRGPNDKENNPPLPPFSKEGMGGLSDEKGDNSVQGWIDKLKLILKEIFVIHEECLAYAETRSRELRQQILCLQRDTRAVKGYAPQKFFSPRFIDTAK